MRIPELTIRSKSTYRMAIALVVVAGCHSGSGERIGVSKLGVQLVSPGFEDGPPRELTGSSRPWVGEEPGEIFIVNDGTAHSGSQHATMVGSNGQLMQMVSLSPNTGYLVSAWVAGTPGIDEHATQPPWIRGFFVAPKGGADLDDDGDDGFDGPPYLKAVPITTGSGAWQEISFTFNSGPYSDVSINFDVVFSDQILKVDDVSVTELSDAPPLHPTLSGSAGDGRVDLSWTDYPGTNSYVIWRADTAVEFARPIARVDGTSFTDTGVTNGREYSYQVAVEDGTEVWIFSYNRLLFTPAPGFCGDGTCGSGEDCSNCQADCGACGSCGDGTCGSGEDCSNCEADCGACSSCGDGTCSSDEDCTSCEADCGSCSSLWPGALRDLLAAKLARFRKQLLRR